MCSVHSHDHRDVVGSSVAGNTRTTTYAVGKACENCEAIWSTIRQKTDGCCGAGSCELWGAMAAGLYVFIWLTPFFCCAAKSKRASILVDICQLRPEVHDGDQWKMEFSVNSMCSCCCQSNSGRFSALMTEQGIQVSKIH